MFDVLPCTPTKTPTMPLVSRSLDTTLKAFHHRLQNCETCLPAVDRASIIGALVRTLHPSCLTSALTHAFSNPRIVSRSSSSNTPASLVDAPLRVMRTPEVLPPISVHDVTLPAAPVPYANKAHAHEEAAISREEKHSYDCGLPERQDIGLRSENGGRSRASTQVGSAPRVLLRVGRLAPDGGHE